MTKNFLFLLPLVPLLASCTYLYEMRQERHRNECLSYGIKAATPEMAMCMSMQDKIFQTQNQARIQQMNAENAARMQRMNADNAARAQQMQMQNMMRR